MEDELTMNDMNWFTVWFGLIELLGATMLILMGVWLNNYRGGFSWRSNPQKEFNWHPLLMTIGMIFLYANGILIYRTFRNSRKKVLKIVHASIHVTAFVTSVIGLRAVFDSHNLAKPPIPNMYSLHSWLGLGAVLLFVCQWIAGFVTFLYPGLGASVRAAYLPLHTSCGREAFALACIAALLGLTEKAIFSVKNYSELPNEGYLINFLGIVILLFMCFVVYLVSMTKYKRKPLPEDEMLLASQKPMCAHRVTHAPTCTHAPWCNRACPHTEMTSFCKAKSHPVIKLRYDNYLNRETHFHNGVFCPSHRFVFSSLSQNGQKTKSSSR